MAAFAPGICRSLFIIKKGVHWGGREKFSLLSLAIFRRRLCRSAHMLIQVAAIVSRRINIRFGRRGRAEGSRCSKLLYFSPVIAGLIAGQRRYII